MAESSIQVRGIREVNAALYSYSQKLGDFVVFKALREGATVVKKQISALAPVYHGPKRLRVKSGTLKRGFRISKSRIHNGKLSNSLIGVYLTLKKGGGRNDPNDPFYGRWQELGWNTAGRRASRSEVRAVLGGRSGRKTLRGGTNVPGKHFVQRAFDSRKVAAVDVIVKSATAGADVLARKVGL